jgi:hypothetical protein
VDKQNQMTVTHGHVLKGLIRVTSPEKPFPRVSLAPPVLYLSNTDMDSGRKGDYPEGLRERIVQKGDRATLQR